MLKQDYKKAYLPDQFDFEIEEDLRPDWFHNLERIGDDIESLIKYFPQEYKIFLQTGLEINFYIKNKVNNCAKRTKNITFNNCKILRSY